MFWMRVASVLVWLILSRLRGSTVDLRFRNKLVKMVKVFVVGLVVGLAAAVQTVLLGNRAPAVHAGTLSLLVLANSPQKLSAHNFNSPLRT
jgi:hypothetical protein